VYLSNYGRLYVEEMAERRAKRSSSEKGILKVEEGKAWWHEGTRA
jgi:hypothetical protein